MKRILSGILLKYFRLLAKIQLKKFSPDIIGITGSTGKTSCRNAVVAILKDKYRLKVGYKANSESGIPLNILGLAPKDYSLLDWLRLAILAPLQLIFYWEPHDKYLVEMGIDSPHPPKNMDYLLTILRPRTAIFLNALTVHTQEFDSLITAKDPKKRAQQARTLIAQEKGKLISSLPKNGLAILNADDPYVIAFKKKTQAQVMTFGQQNTNHIILKEYQANLKGTTFTYQAGNKKSSIHLPNYLLPQHYQATLAAALVLGLDEDFALQEACQLIQSNFTLPPGRSSLIKGINQSHLLDSSYNASPQTVTDSLNLLSQIKNKRKLALLADMRELGAEAPIAHQDIARQAVQVCRQIILVGPLMHQYAAPIINKHPQTKLHLADNADHAAQILKPTLKPGDLLLIKGSQNTLFLEAAVKALMENPSQAKTLLCRQSPYWQSRRRAIGLKS